MLRGSKNVVVNAFDPIEGDPNYDAGGVRWLNNITGSYDRALEIYRGVDSTSGGAFGKSIGLGDIELMCDPAPLQIGNRLWNDQNSDGTQDPGEPGLSGALVQLVYNGVVLSTTTTASDSSTPSCVWTLSSSRARFIAPPTRGLSRTCSTGCRLRRCAISRSESSPWGRASTCLLYTSPSPRD